MAQWNAAFNGSYGGSFRLYVNVDVATQEVGNNRSLIHYSAWVDRISSNGGTIYSYETTCGNTNINGHNPQRCIGGYNTSGTGRIFTMAQNEDYWIGHDSQGNANPFFGANYNSNNSYFGAASLGVNWQLPTIPRYTNITGFYVSEITDVSFKINTSVDATADFLQYSLEDGVGWRDQYSGGFTEYGFTIGNQPSNKPYNLRVRIRRADSGLWTESGVISTRTNSQNKFFGDQ